MVPANVYPLHSTDAVKMFTEMCVQMLQLIGKLHLMPDMHFVSCWPGVLADAFTPMLLDTLPRATRLLQSSIIFARSLPSSASKHTSRQQRH